MAKNKRTLRESQVKKLLLDHIGGLDGDIQTEDQLRGNVLDLLRFVFERGKGRDSTNSKNYTGRALEVFCEYCVEQAINLVGLSGAAVNNDYIKDQEDKYDSLRLDLNVFVNDKLILMQESRTWIDKPFCTMKYQVIEDVIFLPHSRARIASDIIFPIVAFCCDVTERTLSTREYFFNMVVDNADLGQKTSYGADRIGIFQLSKGKRADGYFNAGINEDNVAAYLDYLLVHFKHAKGEGDEKR